MSVSYAANKLRVPPGFEHLLEGLAREILREQPKNLVEFSAQYFRKKLQERDGGVTEANDQTAQTTTQVTPSEPVTTAEPSAEEDTAPSTAAAAAVETQEKIPDETKEGEKVEGMQEEVGGEVVEGGVSSETGLEATEEGGGGTTTESGPSETVKNEEKMEEEGAMQSTTNVENDPGQAVADDEGQGNQEMEDAAAGEGEASSVSQQNLTDDSVAEEVQKEGGEKGGKGEGDEDKEMEVGEGEGEKAERGAEGEGEEGKGEERGGEGEGEEGGGEGEGEEEEGGGEGEGGGEEGGEGDAAKGETEAPTTE